MDRYYGGYPYGYGYAHPYHPYPAYGYHPWGGDPDYYTYDIDVVPREQAAGRLGGGNATKQGGGNETAHQGGGNATTLSGQVTAIDRQNGRVTLKSERGPLQLSLPPSALRDVDQGEHVSELIGPSPSPSASPACYGTSPARPDSTQPRSNDKRMN